MVSLVELKQSTDVKKTIEDFMSKHDHFGGVMLVAINKDGSQYLATSTMSGMEKAFLVQFLNSYMNNWYMQIRE